MMNSAELGLIVTVAAAISAGIILVLRPWLQRYLLAHPNSRSSHRQSTPQGGGIAVIVAALAVAAIAAAHRPASAVTRSGVALAGVCGNRIHARWSERPTISGRSRSRPASCCKPLAVGIMLASLPAEFRVVPMLPWWIERALLLLACLWFVNLTNFMDGIDWMTVAEFVPITVGLTLIGFLGALPPRRVLSLRWRFAAD